MIPNFVILFYILGSYTQKINENPLKNESNSKLFPFHTKLIQVHSHLSCWFFWHPKQLLSNLRIPIEEDPFANARAAFPLHHNGRCTHQHSECTRRAHSCCAMSRTQKFLLSSPLCPSSLRALGDMRIEEEVLGMSGGLLLLKTLIYIFSEFFALFWV